MWNHTLVGGVFPDHRGWVGETGYREIVIDFGDEIRPNRVENIIWGVLGLDFNVLDAPEGSCRV